MQCLCAYSSFTNFVDVSSCSIWIVFASFGETKFSGLFLLGNYLDGFEKTPSWLVDFYVFSLVVYGIIR